MPGPKGNFDFRYTPQPDGTISNVALTNVPEVTVGESAVTYNFTDPNNLYTAKGEWQVFNTGTKSYETVPENTPFETGKTYKLALTVTPDLSYVFEEDNVSLSINGGEHFEHIYMVKVPHNILRFRIPCASQRHGPSKRLSQRSR